MSIKQQEWPEVGELVLATVNNVVAYGAYVTLDEYEKKGLLHISEISSSWVRHIRNIVREGQKVVLKVLRVTISKNQIDLSLRRVTKREKIEKIKSWKQERKAEVLLKSVAEKMGVPITEVYTKAGLLIDKAYGLYSGLELMANAENISPLTKIGVPEELAKVIAEIAKERISSQMVFVKGIVELQSGEPDGVEIIKKAFLNAKKSEQNKNVKINFSVIAVPKYHIEVRAKTYKQAENIFQKIGGKIVSTVIKNGGQGSFERVK